MGMQITVDGTAIRAEEGWTILQASLEAGIYIPSLCAHPDLRPQKTMPPAKAVHLWGRKVAHDPAADGPDGCGLCAVEIKDEGVAPACATRAQPEMTVITRGVELEGLRRRRLARILARHPHACLTCAQNEGCTREPCSMNVPANERCCSLLGRCELQAVADHVGIDPATPRYVATGTGPITSEPLFSRDPALCIACGRCVRACTGREVEALGWVRDSSGDRWVGPLSPTPLEAGCRLCGSCVEVCPTGALTDKNVRMAEREAELVPCRHACPAGTDVPRYVRLVAEGRFEDAAAVVAERAPLVQVLGHVCFHPCEDACRRNDVNAAPISICRIKREAGEASAATWTLRLPPPMPDSGRRVAVIGAGPAGLTTAFLLRRMGHQVVVMEARAEIGGMLTHGIPPFRLPRAVALRESAALLEGIEVRTNTPVGADGSTVESVLERHDAVIVATGAGLSLPLDVPGAGLRGVRSGIEVLSEMAEEALDEDVFKGKIVLVVGGGNVAVDCGRAALRSGASRVDLICLEAPDEMPAYSDEVRQAAAEGVRFHHAWGIRAFVGNAVLTDVSLMRCTRVFDDGGRFAPTYDEAMTEELPADVAIVAVGQRADTSILSEIPVGLFLAGDFASGPRSVVEAIASARETAQEVDGYLGGRRELPSRLAPEARPLALGRVDGFTGLPRLEPDPLPAGTPRNMYLPEPVLGRDKARQEADRCLCCDLRLFYRSPLPPPSKDTKLPLAEGSVLLIPESEGVVRFYDDEGAVLEIAGVADMRALVAENLSSDRAATFDFEACPMYTQRQNELLSQYMEVQGRMPPGLDEDDDLDDLY